MNLFSTEHSLDPFGLFNVVYINKPEDMDKSGVLILWGGADIGTSLYGEKPNSQCFTRDPSRRDLAEIALIKHAVKLDIPIIGVCRGAQLACVMAGGKLVQHIDNHGVGHTVTLHDEDDVKIRCNSSHHQMMLPPSSAKILATSDSTTGLGEYNKALHIDRVNEVVYFPSINALGIQPHPEWQSSPIEFNDYCTRKIKEYLL